MRVRCPCCWTEFDLDAAAQGDAARTAVAAALRALGPVAGPLITYLGMFRTPKRAVPFDRLQRLLDELVPMITAQQVTRDGVTSPAPTQAWVSAISEMVELRDKLTLPLKSHGYLLDVVVSQAGKLAAAAETAREAQRRHPQRVASTPSPVAVGSLVRRASADPALVQKRTEIMSLLVTGQINDEECRKRLAALDPAATTDGGSDAPD